MLSCGCAWFSQTSLTACFLNYITGPPSFLPPCHVSMSVYIYECIHTYILTHHRLLLVVCCLLSDAFCLPFCLYLKHYAASCYCMSMCYLLPADCFPLPVICRLLQWQADASVSCHLPVVCYSTCYLTLHGDCCILIILSATLSYLFHAT